MGGIFGGSGGGSSASDTKTTVNTETNVGLEFNVDLDSIAKSNVYQTDLNREMFNFQSDLEREVFKMEKGLNELQMQQLEKNLIQMDKDSIYSDTMQDLTITQKQQEIKRSKLMTYIALASIGILIFKGNK